MFTVMKILQGNDPLSDYMDVERQLPNYSLDNMSAGFEDDNVSNTDVSVTANEEEKQNAVGADVRSEDKTRVNQTMDCATSLEANTSDLIGFNQKKNDLDKFIGELTNNEMMKQLMASPPPNGYKEDVYGGTRRRRKPGPACVTPYQKQPETTPQPRKRAKIARKVTKPLVPVECPINDTSDGPRLLTTDDIDWQKLHVEPFSEVQYSNTLRATLLIFNSHNM